MPSTSGLASAGVRAHSITSFTSLVVQLLIRVYCALVGRADAIEVKVAIRSDKHSKRAKMTRVQHYRPAGTHPSRRLHPEAIQPLAVRRGCVIGGATLARLISRKILNATRPQKYSQA